MRKLQVWLFHHDSNAYNKELWFVYYSLHDLFMAGYEEKFWLVSSIWETKTIRRLPTKKVLIHFGYPRDSLFSNLPLQSVLKRSFLPPNLKNGPKFVKKMSPAICTLLSAFIPGRKNAVWKRSESGITIPLLTTFLV